MGNWVEQKLSAFVKGKRGVSYKPFDLRESKNSSTYYLLRSNNIQDSKLDLTDTQIVDKACVRESQSLEKGDIVVCMSNGSKRLVGKSCLFNLDEKGYCVGAFCSSFSPNDIADSDFVFQLFQSDQYQRLIDISLAGSAINNLQNSTIEEFEFLVPESKAEQFTIAQILTGIDKAIERTKQLITKHERIKTGLMQDLLTRGIDEDGNIRREETHKFKNSPLGRIPIEWKGVSIGSISEYIGSGVTPRGGSNVYQATGIMLIRSQNVYPEGLSLEDVAYISESINDSMLRSEVFEDDVLLNITGASIGRCTYIPKGFPRANVNQHVCAIRLTGKNCFKAIFLSEFLNSEFGQNQIFKYNAGSNREGLNYSQVRGIELGIPEQDSEFERIAKVLISCKDYLESLRLEQSKFSSLKTAMMQDLLTGKVRIDALLNQPAEVV
jgi:type I restriction enzyme S subunit